MKVNPLVAIVAAAVVVATIFVILRSTSVSSGQQETATVADGDQVGTGDGDTTAETLRTVAAELAAAKERNEKLTEQFAEFQANAKRLEQANPRNEPSKGIPIQTGNPTPASPPPADPRLQEIMDRLDVLGGKLNPKSLNADATLPIGLVPDAQSAQTPIAEHHYPTSPSTPSYQDGLHWTQALTAQPQPVLAPTHTARSSEAGSNKTGLLGFVSGLSNASGGVGTPSHIRPSALDNTDVALAGQQRGSGAAAAATTNGEPPQPIPRYTIPLGTQLTDAKAWTALVGKVSVGNRLEDPWEFKVLAGRDALAANGHQVPGLSHSIWRGVARGDWTLSCVRGDITAITYIFTDGTIHTVTAKGGEANALATITDSSGNPCVFGEKVTDAPMWLLARMATGALTTGATAVRDAETTNISSGDSVSSAVTGDTARYAAADAFAGGANDLSQWIQERQAQSWDAIYVPPGKIVGIDVRQQINIDYNPIGRKVNHAQANTSRNARLD